MLRCDARCVTDLRRAQIDTPSATPEPFLGQLVDDRYQVESVLSRGSVGMVYRATQVRLGRPVALKVLAPDVTLGAGGSSSVEHQGRFLREAEALARLTHPNTVRVIDYGKWRGHWFLAMEFVEGQPLRELFAAGPVEPARLLPIIEQVTGSLREAHGVGVIHRDLKPSNIILTGRHGEADHVKVVDFGLAAQAGERASALDGTGVMVGTPAYVPPEQIMGEPVDGRSDVYSLGILLFEGLAGRRPFVATENSRALLLKHLEEDPPPLRSVSPSLDLPPVFDWTVQRCLEKQPQARFATVDELRRALEVCRRALSDPDLRDVELRLLDGVVVLPPELRAAGPTPLPMADPGWTAHAPPLAEEPLEITLDEERAPRRRWPVVLAALAVAGAGLLSTREEAPTPTVGPEQHAGSVQGTVTWGAERVHRLQGTVFVERGATLIIAPGARIEGVRGSALVVTRGGRLEARGTAAAPIVFTSANPPGQRAAGDWGGVALLGEAPVAGVAPDLGQRALLEGLPAGDPRAEYGGDQPGSSAGMLEYARIEFAGYELSANEELNGLTLAGCGSGTLVRHVQVHRSKDDGVEVFGGTVDLQNVLITRPADDGLDWDRGWAGRAQFVVIQQDDARGDHAIEGDGWRPAPDSEPRSAPTLRNVTLVGPADPAVARRAMLVRAGTAGHLSNVLLAGFEGGALDVRGAPTAGQTRTGALAIDHTLAWRIGAGWAEPETGRDDDDGGFDEARWMARGEGNAIAQDSPLRPSAFALSQADEGAEPIRPDFAPRPGTVAAGAGAAPEGDFWDESAAFVGAVRPGTPSPWYEPWASFPRD